MKLFVRMTKIEAQKISVHTVISIIKFWSMVPFYTPCKHQKNKGFEKKFFTFKNLTLKIFFSYSVRLLLNILSNVTIKPTRKTHFEKTVYNIE